MITVHTLFKNGKSTEQYLSMIDAMEYIKDNAGLEHIAAITIY